MMKLTRDRVSKLRCISCGARQKRVAPIFDNVTRKILGFETICCNCGHMQKYAKPLENKLLDDESIRSIIGGNVAVGEVSCGTLHAFCPDKKCRWWKTCHRPPKRPGDDLPKSVYHPEYKEKPNPPRPGGKRAWCPPPPPEYKEFHPDGDAEPQILEPTKIETPHPETNRFL